MAEVYETNFMVAHASSSVRGKHFTGLKCIKPRALLLYVEVPASTPPPDQQKISDIKTVDSMTLIHLHLTVVLGTSRVHHHIAIYINICIFMQYIQPPVSQINSKTLSQKVSPASRSQHAELT